MFTIHKALVADVAPFEYIGGTTSEVIVLGEALKLTNGVLTKATGTDKPSHVCMGVKNSNGHYPVISVTGLMEFETIATATIADTKIGTNVTIGADGLSVTGTATDGKFTISYTDGATSGGVVCGYFK